MRTGSPEAGRSPAVERRRPLASPLVQVRVFTEPQQGATYAQLLAVAKLAGLPEPILARARALLASLEGGEAFAGRPRAKTELDQLDLFAKRAPSAASEDILSTLRELDTDRLTWIEALQLLARLKGKL